VVGVTPVSERLLGKLLKGLVVPLDDPATLVDR
jgi:hypothetical protein